MLVIVIVAVVIKIINIKKKERNPSAFWKKITSRNMELKETSLYGFVMMNMKAMSFLVQPRQSHVCQQPRKCLRRIHSLPLPLLIKSKINLENVHGVSIPETPYSNICCPSNINPCGFKSASSIVIPRLLGTRDWFRGRQAFQGQGGRGAMVPG